MRGQNVDGVRGGKMSLEYKRREEEKIIGERE